MPAYEVQAPDGRKFRVNAPDGATQEDAIAYVQKRYMFQAPPVTDRAAMFREAAAEMGPVRAGVAKAGGAVLDAMDGLRSLIGRGDDDAERADRAVASQGLRDTHPVASFVGDVGANAGMMAVGGMALRGAGALAGALNAGRAGQAATAAGNALLAPTSWQQAGAAGAAYGAATTPGDLLDRAGAAAAGGAGGVAGYGLAAGGGRLADKIRTESAAKLATRQGQNTVRDATLSAGRQAGYVATPSTADAGIGSRLLEGLSGKYKTEQLAGIKNQEVTESLARAALNLADDAPITPDVLAAIRRDVFDAGYRPVRSAGVVRADAQYAQDLARITQAHQGATRSFPGAKDSGVNDLIESVKVGEFDSGDAIDMIKLLRDQADQAFRGGNNALGKAAKDAAKAMENQVERHLSATGDDGAAMLKAFRDARQMIAKTHTVEKALNEGSGRVSATKLGQELGRGKPLSGELRTIAEYAQAFPKLTRLPDSGNANPLTVWDFGFGGLGVGAGNPAMVALPLARVGARQAILSPAYQNAFVNPVYQAARLPGLLDVAGAGARRLGAPLGLRLRDQR